MANDKRKAKVVAITISPNADPVQETVGGPFSPKRAMRVCDQMNEAAIMAEFDPDRIVTFATVPA